MTAKEASEASDRLISPLFQLRDTESHVDVTARVGSLERQASYVAGANVQGDIIYFNIFLL